MFYLTEIFTVLFFIVIAILLGAKEVEDEPVHNDDSFRVSDDRVVDDIVLYDMVQDDQNNYTIL